MQENIDAINERIIRYRKLAGYTQETAAQALGLKKTTYARMERHGHPTPDLILKMSMVFNVSVNMLFYGQDNIVQQQPALPVTQLREPEPKIPMAEPPMTLTANEKSLINTLRSFSKNDKESVTKFINEIYQKNKKA